MAKIDFKGTLTEYMGCVYLLSKGKANSEQQRMAYEYLIGKVKFDSPIKKLSKKEKIGATCEIIRRYELEKDIDADSPYHFDSCTPIYESVAESYNLKPDTVKGYHTEFKQHSKAKQDTLINVLIGYNLMMFATPKK